MNKLLLLVLLITPFSPALCQSSATVDSAEIKNIRVLLELTGSSKLAKQMMEQMISSFKQSLPDVSEDYWTKFQSEVDYNELTDLIVPIYEKHFTNDEILQLISFYKSPIGQKYIQELPGIMQESMQAGQQWGYELGERIISESGGKK